MLVFKIIVTTCSVCLVCPIWNAQVISIKSDSTYSSTRTQYGVHSNVLSYHYFIICTAVQPPTTCQLLSQERKATLVHTSGLYCKVLHQGIVPNYVFELYMRTCV